MVGVGRAVACVASAWPSPLNFTLPVGVSLPKSNSISQFCTTVPGALCRKLSPLRYSQTWTDLSADCRNLYVVPTLTVRPVAGSAENAALTVTTSAPGRAVTRRTSYPKAVLTSTAIRSPTWMPEAATPPVVRLSAVPVLPAVVVVCAVALCFVPKWASSSGSMSGSVGVVALPLGMT